MTPPQSHPIRFGVAALKRGHQVKTFLMGEGVECENIKNPKFNVAEQMGLFVEAGGEILACGT